MKKQYCITVEVAGRYTRMVKLLVEVLQKTITGLGDVGWIVEKARTLDFGTILTAEEKLRARTKMIELRSQLSSDYKIRVLEFHNDEFGDRNRKGCNILYEL